ncbi:response regulator [Paucibacter sp. Y2R2-4]|uniref:response regulator n=1 Tax=Paucibacter sp. Y2R2-4 TaxID=2893553 RepID=UPI0021E4F6A5|nr:response regulator [Paucibacter sp. Y2R2-4]MCV2351233.1 response regulator [Paucibacter sp. Y2R2-4]
MNEEDDDLLLTPRHSLLLLDDDPGVGLAAQLLLQRRVAPITCLRRPAELMAALDKLQPSLLLLDLNFGPGRTDGEQGLKLLSEVLARAAPPVVVVMTAYAEIELAVQALRRGAFDFITKPWDNPRLIATCREALQRYEQQGQGRAPAAASAHDLIPSEETDRSLAAQERAALLSAMAAAEGNLSAAARSLGLSRAALYRRLDKHGL